MSILSKIVEYIKRLFKKEKDIDLIDEPKIENVDIENKNEFIESLRLNTVYESNKIETLVCVGDGLGIQGNITY